MKPYATFLFYLCFMPLIFGQEFTLEKIDDLTLSPKMQSPLYQDFNVNEFDLLVKNVNVFDSPDRPVDFDFVEASSRKEQGFVSQNFYNGINRQMAQYSNFKIEIDNSENLFMDYHQEPIYSGLNRVRNDAFIEANRLNPASRFGNPTPLLYSPSLTSRRGIIWY